MDLRTLREARTFTVGERRAGDQDQATREEEEEEATGEEEEATEEEELVGTGATGAPKSDSLVETSEDGETTGEFPQIKEKC